MVLYLNTLGYTIQLGIYVDVLYISRFRCQSWLCQTFAAADATREYIQRRSDLL